eukprot:Phypoly_transcript_20414.p1 GENE.Phypoly_transcript_20414~~Phypoly_transcript_20414.p1  ORF type:complete len:215 (+),score=33.69 Phypoly_transcript_20414:50-646(+)
MTALRGALSNLTSQLKIAYLGNAVLHTVAKPFTKEEVVSSETKTLINRMHKLLEKESGVGLAAPQVEVAKQVFVIKVDHSPAYPRVQEFPFTALFNPTWKPIDKSVYLSWESCLSLPDVWGPVERYNRIKVSYLDKEGNDRELEADGHIAAIIQHESDHLKGQVFITKVKNVNLLVHASNVVGRYNPTVERGSFRHTK